MAGYSTPCSQTCLLSFLHAIVFNMLIKFIGHVFVQVYLTVLQEEIQNTSFFCARF
jgi:hypothetical protein